MGVLSGDLESSIGVMRQDSMDLPEEGAPLDPLRKAAQKADASYIKERLAEHSKKSNTFRPVKVIPVGSLSSVLGMATFNTRQVTLLEQQQALMNQAFAQQQMAPNLLLGILGGI